DLVRQPLAVVARDALLLREVAARVREDLVAKGRLVDVRVEEPRAEHADHGEMDPVLPLCEGIVATRGRHRAGCCQTLVQIHDYCLLASRCRRGDFAGDSVSVSASTAAVVRAMIASERRLNA